MLRLVLLSLLLLTACDDERQEEQLELWFIDSSERALRRLDPETRNCDLLDYLNGNSLVLAAAAFGELYSVDQVTRELLRIRPYANGESPVGVVDPLSLPQSMAADDLGRLYLLDNNSRLLRLNPETAAQVGDWTLPGGLYASLFFSPVSFRSPLGVDVDAWDLLVLRQAAGQSWLARLDLRQDPPILQDLAQLPALISVCASRITGEFYASDGSSTLYRLDPESGSLSPLFQTGCGLEEALELAAW